MSILSPKIERLFLILVVLLASVLRLVQLTNFPAGFNADEAAVGYNVYSLLETEKDEHGNVWPVHFKSFGDYKPGGYFYLVLPFVKVLGLNELSVRLPSALLGIIAILLLYLLVKELFKSASFALISSFFLAISPWHIHFSRGGWEANAATTFILLGVLLFVYSFRKPKYFPFSVLSFIMAMYTYHSARVVVPILVFGLIILCRKNVFTQFRWKILGIVLGVILMIPLGLSFLSPAVASRFSGVGLFSDTGPYWRVNELRGNHLAWNNLNVRLLHNQVIGYSFAFLQNYFSHFDGNFLFLSGDIIQRNRVPETGQTHLFEIPFVLAGILFFLKQRPENWKVVFLWLAIAPIAAAMTFQTPHALRAHNMIIPLTIISAYGLWNSLLWVKTRGKLLVALFNCFIVTLLLWSVGRYLHQYFVHYSKEYPTAWEYGFKELVGFIKPIQGDYTKILVTDRYDQPYILFLFYLRYPPENFQKEAVLTPRDKFGFSTVTDFDKYHFESIDWQEVKNERDVLVVGTAEEIPNDANVIKTIKFPNGEAAFKIVEL